MQWIKYLGSPIIVETAALNFTAKVSLPAPIARDRATVRDRANDVVQLFCHSLRTDLTGILQATPVITALAFLEHAT